MHGNHPFYLESTISDVSIICFSWFEWPFDIFWPSKSWSSWLSQPFVGPVPGAARSPWKLRCGDARQGFFAEFISRSCCLWLWAPEPKKAGMEMAKSDPSSKKWTKFWCRGSRLLISSNLFDRLLSHQDTPCCWKIPGVCGRYQMTRKGLRRHGVSNKANLGVESFSAFRQRRSCMKTGPALVFSSNPSWQTQIQRICQFFLGPTSLFVWDCDSCCSSTCLISKSMHHNSNSVLTQFAASELHKLCHAWKPCGPSVKSYGARVCRGQNKFPKFAAQLAKPKQSNKQL